VVWCYGVTKCVTSFARGSEVGRGTSIASERGTGAMQMIVVSDVEEVD